MSLVRNPLTHVDGVGPAAAGPTVRAMEIGQYVIAVVLTTIGVIRAVGDATSVAVAIVAGLAIVAWHTAGALVPARSGSRSLTAWWLAGFAVVWIAASAVSPEFVWVAFVLWLLAGHVLPLPWGLGYSAVVLAVVVVAPILHHGTTTYANVFGPAIGGVFAFGISRGYLQLLKDAAERERLVSSLTTAHAELAELQDELARAGRESGAIAERTRISRDIHDTIAQHLSSIRLLAHAGSDHSADPAARRALAQIEALSGDGLADVRRIVAALAPGELEREALTSALERILDRARDEAGLVAELRADDTIPQLPTAVEVALLRTAQSAIANVRRHAGASRVVMSLIDADTSVRLDIIDDGSGFDVAGWESGSGSATGGFGLRFIRARLRELGGGLEIESAPGEGTAISVHVPIHQGQDHAEQGETA